MRCDENVKSISTILHQHAFLFSFNDTDKFYHLIINIKASFTDITIRMPAVSSIFQSEQYCFSFCQREVFTFSVIGKPLGGTQVNCHLISISIVPDTRPLAAFSSNSPLTALLWARGIRGTSAMPMYEACSGSESSNTKTFNGYKPTKKIQRSK